MKKVTINSGKNRFELQLENAIAVIEFIKIEPNILDLVHTEVPEEFGGKGIGSKLILGVLEYVKANNLLIHPSCPFIQKFINKHPEWNQFVAKSKS